ncbi:MAG: VWA domain-containing protein [Candidatus Sulfotelmatobacter sp.]
MGYRRFAVFFAVALLCVLGCWFFLSEIPGGTRAYAQSSPDQAATFHAESRLVLVDSIVTDKKGNYVRDLEQKDFKVWEDGKEQAITSFSYDENTGSTPAAKIRYMVLFFDNSSMGFGDQANAREAATKFIEANAGPDRLIAIAEFGGTVTITQNFTSNADRLKQVVAGIKGSAVSPNPEPSMASLGPPSAMPSLSSAEADFGVHTVLLALRDLAKGMAGVPGRKTLVMLTAGFVLNSEYESEITAAIDTCNKSNVAIYPIDVRGLVAPVPTGPHSRLQQPAIPYASLFLVSAAFHPGDHQPAFKLAAFAEPAANPAQHGGAGGGGGGGGHGGGGTGGGGGVGGGGHSGGGTGGGTGGHSGGGSTGGSTGGGRSGGTAPGGGYAGASNGLYNPYNQPRQIVPPFPPSATDNQQVMYQLADGTGGFVILNTNDLLGGMQRIAQDQNQYYLLGYVPAVNAEGSCHSLKVKVERHGTEVRARSGYCTTRPTDLLAGNPIEKDLESRATGEMKGNVAASMEAPFFYTSPDAAQIHLAVEIPSYALKFEKVKGKQHAALNILGIAYKLDQSIAARFSDTVNLDFDDKKEVEQFQKQPFHYENQFGIASGQYNLRVVFSSGNESFGKLEAPLLIDPYGQQQFSISGVALSNSMRKAADLSTDLDSLLLEDRTPLVVHGLQISPSATNHFKKTDVAAIYAEIYEPLLRKPSPPEVAFELFIVDLKTGTAKFHINERMPKPTAVNPVIALGLKLPVAQLDPGAYRLDLRAMDSAGNSSKTRSTEFEVE